MSNLPLTSSSLQATTSDDCGMETRSGKCIRSNLSTTSTTALTTHTSPSVKTRASVDSLWTIELIGRTSHEITGAKLPSNRQLMQMFFYNVRFVKLTARESARLAVSAVLIYWQQARIPTQLENKCIEKVLKLYDQWKSIRKRVASERTGAKKEMENTFVDALDDLFDIAHANALEQMRIEDDKEFLRLQRQKGRPGCMGGIDMTLYAREKRVTERKEKELARKRRYEEMCQEQGKNFGSIINFIFIYHLIIIF